MDSTLRDLVNRLHAAPDAPGALDAVRAHLQAIGKSSGLVKVLEWWAERTTYPAAGADALLEAAELCAHRNPVRARDDCLRALELDPTIPAFATALASVFPRDPATRLDLLRRRVLALQETPAAGAVVARASVDYARELMANGHRDEAVAVLEVYEHQDAEAKAMLSELRPGAPEGSRVALLKALEEDESEGHPMSFVSRLASDIDALLGEDLDDEPTSVSPFGEGAGTLGSGGVRGVPAPEDNSATEPGGRAFGSPAGASASPLPHASSRAAGPHAPDSGAPARRAKAPASASPSASPARPVSGAPASSAGQSPVAQAPAGRSESAAGRSAPSSEPAAAAQRTSTPAAAPHAAPAPFVFDPEPASEEDDEEDVAPMVNVAPVEVLAPGERAKGGAVYLEVSRFVGDGLIEAKTISGGGLRDPRFPGTATLRFGEATVRLVDADDVRVTRADGTDDAAVSRDAPIVLAAGDRLDLHRGALRYCLRVLRRRAAPARARASLPLKPVAWGIALAIFAHAFLAAGLEIIASTGFASLEVDQRPQEEIFAEARLTPPERPEPPPRPRPRPRRVERTKAPPRETRTELPRSLRDRVRRLQDRQPRSEDATENLLARLTTPNAGSASSIAEATTNIDAVGGGPLAGGTTVTGVQSALEGVSGVNVASQPGGENVGTLGGSDAAGQAAQLDQREGQGRVRGRVRAVSALGRQSGGSLSRGEVQGVINRYIGRIQQCYERALLANPSIAGRVTFAWTITPSGAVSGVRQQSSTLGNASVTSCIAGVIRRMRFPRPEGGAVQIAYPFMFQRAP